MSRMMTRLKHSLVGSLLVAVLIALAPPPAFAAEKQVFQSPDLPPNLPFSAVVRVGDML